MNKHLPVLIFLLGFGLVGCVTALKTTNYASHQTVEDNVYHYEKIVENYEDIQWANWQEVYKSEAMSIETGERYFRDYLLSQWVNEDNANVVSAFDNQTKTTCEELFKSKCVITRSNNFTDAGEKIYWKSLTEYKLAQETKILAEEKERQRKLDQEQEEKQRLIASLTKRCEDYGFTGDNNIAACIQREAQHDKELEMQKWELEKTRLALQQAQSRTYVQQQPEEEEVPLLIQMLGDIAVGVAEGYKNQQIYQQPQQKQSIYRNCKPNC
jgi:hypothetical protein